MERLSRAAMLSHHARVRRSWWLLLVCVGCGSAPAAEPPDIDLAPVRAAFHCDSPRADGEACRILTAFDAASAVSAWPTGSEEQIWLGVDHCVQPTAAASYDVYQQVYLRAAPGSPLPTPLPAARMAPASAVFGSNQIQRGAMPNQAAALAAYATGRTPDPSIGPMEGLIFASGDGVYRALAWTLSHRSVGDGPSDTGIWFLRSDGTHLYLIGPRMQGGCASELFRVPRSPG